MLQKLIALLALCSSLTICALENAWVCGGLSMLAAGASVDRQYPRDREIDIKHFLLDVTPNFEDRTVAGTAVLTFEPIGKPLADLKLDAVDLRISDVKATVPIQAWHNTSEQVLVSFANPIQVGQSISITIQYSAQPQKGLYFRTPQMGYKQGETHLFTQGEAIEARHWYPCFDAPNEKFTSEMICHVPAGMVVLSNGRLVNEGTTNSIYTARWLQDKPHVNYLISLVAGHLAKIEAKYRDLPLAFYTVPSEIAQAQNSFRETIPAMEFFEKEIGVPYPWAKYYQVCVTDFHFGGMENTSISTLTEGTLFDSSSENIRSSAGLVAHELAHQWFGDLVTTKDWSHLWLNEGFATYYTALFSEHRDGRDDFLLAMHRSAQNLTSRKDDTRPMIHRHFDDPADMMLAVGDLTYSKGAWVLHMLRSQLGPELYRKCIKTYVERKQYGSASTEDLNEIVEELSGRSFDRFFDQWVYHGSHPLLDASYSWDERTKLAKISLSQTQVTNHQTVPFEFPLTIRFKDKTGKKDQRVVVRNRKEDFYFPLQQAPEVVRFDPDVELLARFNFRPSREMLMKQVKDSSDAVGRILAIEEFGKQSSSEAVKALSEALRTDSFYAARQAASRALRTIHSDEAFSSLTNSMKQSDARVRSQVMSDIASFFKPETSAILLAMISSEKNPAIMASALRGLGLSSHPEAKSALKRLLTTQSYHNELSDAAVSALRAQEDPASVPGIMEAIRARPDDFGSRSLSAALQAIAHLSRHEASKDQAREFILGYTSSKKQRVRVQALSALGTLGDEKSLPVLQTFAFSNDRNPDQDAAQGAINAIRGSRKPSDEFGTLRSELTTLQKQNTDLRRELDDLKKKIEAIGATPKPKETVKPINKLKR